MSSSVAALSEKPSLKSKTRTVFDNRGVVHAFAQQDQHEGRTSNGNMHFEGNTLYSYATPIARVVPDVSGNKVALITSHTYSVTTSGKHMPGSNDFAYQSFRVPSLGCGWQGRHKEPEPLAWSREVNHEANLAHLLLAYDDEVAQLLRKVKDWERGTGYDTDQPRIVETLYLYRRQALAYASTFGLAKPDRDPTADYAAIMDADAKRNSPEKVAKREADAAKRREKREAAEAAWAKDYRAAWRAGHPLPSRDGIWRYHSRNSALVCEDGGAMLRVKGETLETSQGASVPLAHAIKLFRFVKAVRLRAKRWAANGSTISVGHFRVDSIEANGDFKAGCHRFYWPEVERIAKVIGCYDDAPSLEALDRKAACAPTSRLTA